MRKKNKMINSYVFLKKIINSNVVTVIGNDFNEVFVY